MLAAEIFMESGGARITLSPTRNLAAQSKNGAHHFMHTLCQRKLGILEHRKE